MIKDTVITDIPAISQGEGCSTQALLTLQRAHGLRYICAAGEPWQRSVLCTDLWGQMFSEHPLGQVLPKSLPKVRDLAESVMSSQF